MLTIQNTIDLIKPIYKINEYQEDKLLFFDIETTGFSAEISSLYLIGCAYYQDNTWQITQWFADNYHSEKEMLICFFEFMKSFEVLVHYNGTGFDLPYLLKKIKKYSLTFDFSMIISLDLYKKAVVLKPFYSLANYKQKTIEQFLSLKREDPFSGGELIEYYNQYMQHKILSKPYQEYLSALLLHNKEDLLGLLRCCDILCYPDFFSGRFSLEGCKFEGNCLSINLTLTTPLPKKLYANNEQFSLSVNENQAVIKISAYTGELKYFYSNYKDYFYLPKEDSAIHKSVAAYVDKEFREKAKASNCYTKKTSIFLPQFEEITTPSFLTAYKTKPYYFEWMDSLLENTSFVYDYAKHILKTLCPKITS